MDVNSNIYSEPLFAASQGWLSSSAVSTTQTPASQVAQRLDDSKDREPDDGEEIDEDEEVFRIDTLVVRASDLKQDYCSTGCPHLDECLKGGIPVFGITELYGEAGTAKTQLCLQLSITAQLPECDGGLDAGVMYICTEDALPSKRLSELAYNFKLKYQEKLQDDPMNNIFIEQAPDAESLIQCVTTKLPALATRNEKKIRLVIVDSVAGVFRSEYEDISRRTMELRQFGQILHEFSHNHAAAIVVCNQVTGSPSPASYEGNIASLGTAWKNMVTTRIRLSKSGDHQYRSMYVSFSPHIPSIEVPFHVCADGVKFFK